MGDAKLEGSPTDSDNSATERRQDSAQQQDTAQTAASEMLDAFAAWHEQRTQLSPAPEEESEEEEPEQTQGCEPAPWRPCRPLEPAEAPEHTVFFRQPVTVAPVAVSLGDPIEGQRQLGYACAPVTEIDAELALDLRYEQRWNYRRAVIGALSAAVALAPTETLTLSVRNTQRKQFDQETVDEVERSQLTESTVADKDVLNVTRSASKTNNWTVSGNASISYLKFDAGISGSMSETVTQASTSSAQRSRESTQKSAANLKTLHKVQVRETTEVATEETTNRKITNPYRDRSLRLDVYELAKEYCVEFHLVDFSPSLVFELLVLEFGRHFVLTNGAFLSDELIDRVLQAELVEALQITTDLRIEGNEGKARETALLALEYLFTGPSLFNFTTFPPLSRPSGWNENDPAGSFLEPLEEWSGLSDAVRNKVAVIFSTLAFYFQLYLREVQPNSDGELAIRLAMSLDQILAPRWIGTEESAEIRNVIDGSDATEVLRRLGGFLTMTSGVLKPLLEPAAEEREARQAAERAEFVITRVIEHLHCHRRYYTERYLRYLALQTHMTSVAQFARDLLTDHLPGLPLTVRAAFDPAAAFLDRNRVVVPLRVVLDQRELRELLKWFDRSAPDVRLGCLDTHLVAVPTDGFHMEAVAGECALDGVSNEAPMGPIHVALDER